MDPDLISLSKTVSHALRHAPWLYELEPDEEGWVSVSDLVEALKQRRRWRNLTRDGLTTMLVSGDKRRFELREGRVRALYGHSLPGKLAKEPAEPPAVLYHGTSPEAASAILRGGLKPMRRQYVHLSMDIPAAMEVGRRKAERPVVLTVNAARAHREGVRFYRGNDQVWLADEIPPTYIRASGLQE